MSSLTYRPEVDGLRTVAIIPVILFHLGYSWIDGGYFGVDVFFVISGYLITAILIKDHSMQTFSFKNFWMRRIRRIMPALLCMVIVVLLCSYFFLFKPVLKTYDDDALSAIFSYANIAMLLKFGDYWGAAAESSPFLHCWSLSVEEQFYLIYPILIAAFVNNKARLIKILLLVTILSFASFIWASEFYPTQGFFLLPTRAWELACGGLLSIGGRPFSRFKNILPSIGLVLILLSFFIFTGSKGIGISAVLPVIGSVLIIGYSSQEEFVGRFLSFKPMVEIGKISYSLYLWHWPIIVLAKQIPARLYMNEYLFLVLQIVAILCLSFLSYKLVEQYTRKMKFILSFVFTALLLCLAEVLLFNSYLIESDYISSFNPVHTYMRYYNINPKVKPLADVGIAKHKGTIAPLRDSSFQKAAFNNGIEKGDYKGYPEVVLIGDSHGAAIAKVIDELGDELHFKRSIFTMPGNNPIFPIPLKEPFPQRVGYTDEQFKAYAQNMIYKLTLWKPKLIIIDCKWDIMIYEFDKLKNLVDFAAQNKTTVLFINQPPIIYSMGDNNSAQYFSYLGYKPNNTEQYIPILNTQSVDDANDQLAAFVQKHTNTRIVDINSSFQKNNHALIIRNNSILYFDDDHLSYEGTLIVKEKIADVIREVLSQ